MQTTFPRRVTGPGASALKYDVLTALLVTASQGNAVTSRIALRLSLLITARFNWRAGTFAVGQREMARMWGVSDRTAKREISTMRALNWISVRVPAARGRVTVYQIEFDRLLQSTRPYWSAVGPDFEARMTATPEPAQSPSNVIQLHPTAQDRPDADSTWGSACRVLETQDIAAFNAWLAPLTTLTEDTGILTLIAPSRFVADYVNIHFKSKILAAIPLVSDVRDVRIEAPK